MSQRRVNIRAILADPENRRKIVVEALIATQAREGITTTREQAEAAYDKVQAEKATPQSVARPGRHPSR